jgi:predicted unusual protein kinase regulating ubiquinone biosynthesis (AarF/ABC1/UbiB family)
MFTSNGKVISVYKDELTMADCEELCTKNWVCDKSGKCSKIGVLSGGCRGFITRDPFTSAAQGKTMCWLIPNDVKMSGTYPDEIKFDRLTMHDYGKTTSKKAFIKEQCDCGNRYIHVERDPLRTRLEHLRVELKNLKSVKDRFNASELLKMQNIESEVGQLSDHLRQFKEMASLGGIYDYLPVYIPHRIEKGSAAYIPHAILKATSATASTISGQEKQFSYYWEGPVRITNIYKKLDFSTILYKCMDKRAKPMTEAWYIARRENIIAEAKDILAQGGMEFDGESIPGFDSKDIGLLLTVFFKMRCFGHKIGSDGSIYERDNPHVKSPYKINTNFLGFTKGLYGPADNKGCFKNALKAAKKEEELIVGDILMSDLEGDGGLDEPMPLLENGICEKLLVGQDNTLIKNLNIAEKVLAWQGTLNAAVQTGAFVANAYDGAANVLGGVGGWIGNKLWGSSGETTTTTTTTTIEQKVANVSSAKLLERTRELAEAMKQIVIRIGGIEGAEDEQLKAFCAKEMLELVQNAGGIWPKISQNLAVRPDIVKDDYARNKLKETQSGNKNMGRDKTLTYIRDLDVKVQFPGRLVPLSDFMEYDDFVSAGSVGQVDFWNLRHDTPNARKLAQEFKARVLPSDWTADASKFIVKTVFKETEDLYTRDWKLMSLFFTKLADYMPAKISSIWGVLKNLENSIFDEFDLRKEASFTQRGRAMLKEFTTEAQAANPDAVVVTTPVGLETDSKYVMIQTLAPGKPLSAYLEAVKGQWDRLAEWRTDIYSTILNVFGYTAIKNGFFQADPHPGNWFWDTENRALTLIDWGGVEDWTEEAELKQAHCTLARLYSSMGKMAPLWESCDSVIFQGLGGLDGTYRRHGVSIHQASEGEDELLLGHTYAKTYRHTTKPLTLWYDGETWVISEVDLFHPDVTINKAKMSSAKAARVVDQSFFGLALGKTTEELMTDDMQEVFIMQWTPIDESGKPKTELSVSVYSGRTDACDKRADRTQAYQMAAQQLGIMLKSDCERLMYLDTSDPNDKRLGRHLNTDDVAFVCLHKDDSNELKARVGVPPADHDIVVKSDMKSGQFYIKVQLPVVKGQTAPDAFEESGDAVERDAFAEDSEAIMDLETVEFLLQEELALAPRALKNAEDRVFRPVVHYTSGLDASGVGSNIEWENNPLTKANAGEKTQVLVYDQAQRAYAIAASLFDSDVAELAIMALQGRQSLSMFQPGEVPETYTLFARCAIVFHGMVMDVIRENFMRLVPVNKLQWLLQPYGDRFFQVWAKYADAYIEAPSTTCPDGGWSAIDVDQANPWTCYEYQADQDDAWCGKVRNHAAFDIVLASDANVECGDCGCCKRARTTWRVGHSDI